jgi:hypothetical protein
MKEDKRQFSLQGALKSRLNWYWQIREKATKQMIFVPKSTKRLMERVINLIDDKGIPVIRKLLSTTGRWERSDAQEFYKVNKEICRLTDLINEDAREEGRKTWKNPSLNFRQAI